MSMPKMPKNVYNTLCLCRVCDRSVYPVFSDTQKTKGVFVAKHGKIEFYTHNNVTQLKRVLNKNGQEIPCNNKKQLETAAKKVLSVWF